MCKKKRLSPSNVVWKSKIQYIIQALQLSVLLAAKTSSCATTEAIFFVQVRTVQPTDTCIYLKCTSQWLQTRHSYPFGSDPFFVCRDTHRRKRGTGAKKKDSAQRMLQFFVTWLCYLAETDFATRLIWFYYQCQGWILPCVTENGKTRRRPRSKNSTKAGGNASESGPGVKLKVHLCHANVLESVRLHKNGPNKFIGQLFH